MGRFGKVEREEKMWWAVVDGEVTYTKGLSCWDTPNSWYCPEFESTLRIGHSLFEKENEALKKAIETTENDLVRIQVRLTQLENRYKELEQR